MNESQCVPYEKFCKRLCSDKVDYCFFIHTDGIGEKIKCKKCRLRIPLETPYMCYQKDHYICCLCYANDRMRFLGHYLLIVQELPLHQDLLPALKIFMRQFLVLNEEIFYFESISLECILRWRLPLFWSDTFTIVFPNELLYIRKPTRNDKVRNFYILQKRKDGSYIQTADWESPEKNGWVKWVAILKKFLLTETEFTISDSFIDNYFPHLTLRYGSKSFLIKV